MNVECGFRIVLACTMQTETHNPYPVTRNP